MSQLARRFLSGFTFEKWHGARNDFIFVSANEFLKHAAESLSPSFVEQCALGLCDRAAGLGADGLVVWQQDPKTGHTTAGIWNSDGSRAQTCGNALRCLAAVLFSQGLWDGISSCEVRELTFADTGWGSSEKTFARLLSAQGGTESDSFVASVAMGHVQSVKTGLSLSALPLGQPPVLTRLTPHVSSITFVQLANPHLVLTLHAGVFRTLTNDDFCHIGRYLQSEGVCQALQIPLSNIGFVEEPLTQVQQPAHAVVYERGAGLTSCCGSGGCAMRVATEAAFGPVLKQNEPLQLKMPGGLISIFQQEKELVLNGPAQCVARLTFRGPSED
ncbi:MAG: hypothetical protein RIR26_1008 [Pseudomonadota bacterium]